MVSVKENAIEMEVKRLDTQMSALQKQLEAVEEADVEAAAEEEESEYILEDSDIKYLTMDDLEGLTADECRLARNELYFMHHCIALSWKM